MNRWAIVGPKEMSCWNKSISSSQPLAPRCVLSNANVWLHPGSIVVAFYRGSYSSLVYDANLPRCVCHCVTSESGMNFLQLFQSCGLSLNPLLITVCEPEGAVVRVGPQPAGNFLDSRSLNWCRRLGFTTWPFSPCETSPTLKQIQFTAQCTQKPWHKTEKVLLILWTGCCGNR